MAKSSAMAAAGLLVAVLLLQFSLHPAAARHLLDDEYSQSQLASAANSSLAAGVPPPTAAESHVVWPPANFLTVDFDAVRELYSTFQNRLVTALTGDPPRRLVSDIPLLVEQTGDEPPPEWIFVRLTGRDHRTDKVTIAVRNDNVYLVGFKQDARPGTWFAFEERTHLIPASQILPVGHSYGDLVKGHKNLIDYDMGKASFLHAIHQVATYQPTGDKKHDTAQIAVPLVKLCVMIAEAARFKLVLRDLGAHWQDGTRINLHQAKLVVRWGDISLALLNWHQTGVWQDTKDRKLAKVDIRGPADAVKELNLLLWPKRFSFLSPAPAPSPPAAAAKEN